MWRVAPSPVSQELGGKDHLLAIGCVCVRSHVQLFVTLWTVTCQAPLSMGFFRQEYWRRLPFPTLGDLPDPEIEPTSPVSLALQVDSLPLSHRGSLAAHGYHLQNVIECEQVPFWPLQLPDPCRLGRDLRPLLLNSLMPLGHCLTVRRLRQLDSCWWLGTLSCCLLKQGPEVWDLRLCTGDTSNYDFIYLSPLSPHTPSLYCTFWKSRSFRTT